MAKKRKKIKASPDKFYQQIDWGIDPQTGKEIASLVAFVLGLIFVLSIFGAAGTFGQFILKIMNYLFGLAAAILPVILIIIGVVFWKKKDGAVRGLTILGLLTLIIFVPALFDVIHASAGGVIGGGVANYLMQAFGSIAGFLIIVGFILISLLFATNISIKEAKNWLFGEDEEENPAEADPTKVSVYQALKSKLSSKPQPQLGNQPNGQIPVQSMQPIKQATIDKDWEFPPISLLSDVRTAADPGDPKKKALTIQSALKNFNIDVDMGGANIGPTVTQYVLKPHTGVKLTAITSRANDLALALASRSIRIEAPIPGKSAVGVEIPNEKTATVTLRQVLESKEYAETKSNLKIALGLDVAGATFVADIAKMPHLLVAGSTGAGKSVAINAMVLSLLYANSPADLRIILIDPKRVEFTRYNGIPHLLTSVVTEVDKIVNTLRWTVAEMDRRYNVFAEGHHRNIEEYNKDPKNQPMPYIVVVIDELADLMIQAANEVESSIVRISQLARATGMHLIVATQRPSVNVITGIIKANIATRIAFAVASQIDSRTILDQSGAEQLLGKGDMLFLNSELGKPRRVQGVLVGEKEITAVTDFLKREGVSTYDDSIQDYRPAGSGGGAGGRSDQEDAAYEEAKEVVVSHQKASASFLQTKLRIGYNRAARILDMLESDGIIGPAQGAKARDVLVSQDQLDAPRANVPTYYSNEAPTVEARPSNNSNGIKPFPRPGEIEIQDDDDDL